MRQFFDFVLDARPNERLYVCDYEVGNAEREFDTAIFRRCQVFQGKIPDHVKLWVKPGAPADAIGEPLSWPILSDQLIRVFKALASDDVQEVELSLFCIDTKKPVFGYKVLNVLRSIQAIDLEQSVTSDMNILGTHVLNVIKPVYRGDLIPPDVHVFRPKESMSRIVVSEELAKAMRGKGAGVALIREKMRWLNCEP
jgi:hypothetical protein